MPSGAPVDDVIVYRRAADRYLLVVNAGNIEKDFRWLQGQGPQDVTLRNRSDAYALLALQGPRAQEILQPLTTLDLGALKYYHFADVEVDVVRHRATRGGQELSLSPKEFALLSLLVRRAGQVLSRTIIAEQVWDMNFDSDTNVIDVAIRRLRQKVDDPFELKLIHTVRGGGYVLRE